MKPPPNRAIERTALAVARKLRNARDWKPNRIGGADLHDIAKRAVDLALDEGRWQDDDRESEQAPRVQGRIDDFDPKADDRAT